MTTRRTDAHRSNAPRNALRDRLLAAEAEDPALRAEYRRRLNAMLERTLSPVKRTWFVALAALCGATAVLLVVLQFVRPWPPVARAALGLGALFAVKFAVLAARIARRGVLRLRADSNAYAALVWIFSLVMAIAMALLSKQPDPFVVVCFLFLLPASVVVLRTAIEQAELRTRERLLELEYKVARLAKRSRDDDEAAGAGVLR